MPRRAEAIARERRIRPIIRRVVRAVMLLLMCSVAGGTYALWQLGVIDEGWRWTRQSFVDVTGDMGMTLEHVYISGSQRITLDEIKELLPKSYEEHLGVSDPEVLPLYVISITRLQELIEAKSWVKSVNIFRQLPKSLHIEIRERVPKYVWRTHDKDYLVDAQGVLIEASESPTSFVVIEGHVPEEQVPELNMMLMANMNLAQRLTGAQWMGNRRWNVQFGEVLVKLPEKNVFDAWRKLSELQRKDQVLDRAIAMLDMRDAERYYLELSK